MNFISKVNYLYKILNEYKRRKKTKYDVLYIVENQDWCIKTDAENLKKNAKYSVLPALKPLGVKNKIIHYGSLNTLITKNKVHKPDPSNWVVVSCFHISPNDKRIEKIRNGETDFVNVWHTINYQVKEQLIGLGVEEEKIKVIPLHVNCEKFYPISKLEKKQLRAKMGIKSNQIVIGSFQKDGNGWGEGLEPKLIKGPDVFCDVVEELYKKYNIYVVLTGPARGYVKKRLEKAEIPYCHHILENASDVSDYYKVIDLYIVSARVEGGPWAVLESMASGIPLITTEVGMANDIVQNGINGMLSPINDVGKLVNNAMKLIENKEIRETCIKNGLITSKNYNYKDLPDKYNRILYRRI